MLGQIESAVAFFEPYLMVLESFLAALALVAHALPELDMKPVLGGAEVGLAWSFEDLDNSQRKQGLFGLGP